MARKTEGTGAKKKRNRRNPTGNLNAQQEKFCKRYALHKNGAQAYGEAYPKSLNNTPQYRAEQASRLLVQPNISTRIKRLAEKIAEIAEKKFEITAERVLQEFAAIAFYKADDYFEWGTVEVPVYTKSGDPVCDKNGEQVVEHVPKLRIRDSKSLTEDQMKAVLAASMTISKTGDPVLEVKMADKVAALKALGQHLKLFNTGVDIKNQPGGNVQIVISPAEANL